MDRRGYWVIGVCVFLAGLFFAATVPAANNGQSREKKAGRNIDEELVRLKARIDEKQAALSKQDQVRLEQQVGRLGSLSTKGREQAVKLLSTNVDRILFVMSPYLRAKNGRIREGVCGVVVGYASPSNLGQIEPLFYDLLKSRDVDSRRCSLHAYLRISPMRALDRVFGQLTARDEELQDLALSVLNRVPAPELAKYDVTLNEYHSMMSQDVRSYWLEKKARGLLAKVAAWRSTATGRPDEQKTENRSE